ncbi:unnamed protein product [Phytophthora fragariaefolia]|uniref:Unnamed protein product n=1 Tax=Phytophthora fragariaefolia TaxID=1490495 RepID=A0A9W6TTF8_9STRA|nr:unnamed protein product [Phytophthora fragariaefolia]
MPVWDWHCLCNLTRQIKVDFSYFAAQAQTPRDKMADSDERLAERTAAMRLDSAPSPSRPADLEILIPNPFERRCDEGHGASDAETPTASPRQGPRDGRITAAPALPQLPMYSGRTMQDRRLHVQVRGLLDEGERAADGVDSSAGHARQRVYRDRYAAHDRSLGVQRSLARADPGGAVEGLLSPGSGAYLRRYGGHPQPLQRHGPGVQARAAPPGWLPDEGSRTCELQGSRGDPADAAGVQAVEERRHRLLQVRRGAHAGLHDLGAGGRSCCAPTLAALAGGAAVVSALPTLAGEAAEVVAVVMQAPGNPVVVVKPVATAIIGSADVATAGVEGDGVDVKVLVVVVAELEARLLDKEGLTAPHGLEAPASSVTRRSIKSWAAQTPNPARPNACWRNCARGVRFLQLPCVASGLWPSLAMKLRQRKSHQTQLKREWKDWKSTLSSSIRGPTSRWSPRARGRHQGPRSTGLLGGHSAAHTVADRRQGLRRPSGSNVREVELATSAGPLILGKLACLVEDSNTSLDFTLGRPIMTVLGYSGDELLVRARGTKSEWELGDKEQVGVDDETTPLQRMCRMQTRVRDIALDTMALEELVGNAAPTDQGSGGSNTVHGDTGSPETILKTQNLTLAYWQLPLSSGGAQVLAFKTPAGYSHLSRMPARAHATATENADAVERHETRTALPSLRVHDSSAVHDMFDSKLAAARAKGLSGKGVKRLREILLRRQDSFRLEFRRDPPVKVEPLQVRVKVNTQPTKAQPRRYSPDDRAFLDRHTAKLLEFGLVFLSHRSRWASAPRFVRKKEQDSDSTADPRMTIDTRGVNESTEAMPWPMPVLEVVLGALEGAQLITFITHRGMYTMTRVPMGPTDAVAYSQGVVEENFGDLLGNGILAWLDDILGYAESEDELPQQLDQVLARCEAYGLKLHAKKCDFFDIEVKWCGKMVSAAGVRHCPDRVQGLVDMQPPQTAGEQQQYLCAVNWMRQSIPAYVA